MSYDNNNYPNRKDWLGKYYSSKSASRSCRCHGSCEWCQNNRLYNTHKKLEKTKQELREFKTRSSVV